MMFIPSPLLGPDKDPEGWKRYNEKISKQLQKGLLVLVFGIISIIGFIIFMAVKIL